MFEEFNEEKMMLMREKLPELMESIKGRLDTYEGLDLQVREIRDSLVAEITTVAQEFFEDLGVPATEDMMHMMAISCINSIMLKKSLMSIGIGILMKDCSECEKRDECDKFNEEKDE